MRAAMARRCCRIDLARRSSRNWRDLRARAMPAAPWRGVVKADGYGLGAAPVARALRAAGCRHFFVAHLAEGLALRAALGAGADDRGAGRLRRPARMAMRR